MEKLAAGTKCEPKHGATGWTVLSEYDEDTYVVRITQGSRHVGDVVKHRGELRPLDRERRPWSEQDEKLRQGYKDAGLEPRLFRWWKSSAIADLIRARDEYAGEPDLADTLRDLDAEIAYRTL